MSPGCRDGQAERLPTGHEDVLTAVVVERFPGESAIESFEAELPKQLRIEERELEAGGLN